MSDRGILIVLSGPSGAGKGTICAALRQQMPNLVYSVSMTTRAPRVGEEEGVSYFFRDKEEFQRLIKEDAFLEYAQVYDNFYGTPKQHVMDLLSEGKSVILEIDIQGAMQVKERFSEAVFIYIVPPSLDILSNRLRDRGTDAADVIDKRLSKASSELALAHRYDYIVVMMCCPMRLKKLRLFYGLKLAKLNEIKKKSSTFINSMVGKRSNAL